MSYNLDEILRQAVSSPTHQQNLFALACSLSREATPTSETLKLLILLCQRSPSHWLQIVRRLSKSNVNLLLSFYGDNVRMYSGFVEAVMVQPNEQWKVALVSRVIKSIEEPRMLTIQQLFRTLSDMLQHMKPANLMDCLLTNGSLVGLLIQNIKSTHADYNNVVHILMQRYRRIQRQHLADLTLLTFQHHFNPLYNFMKMYVDNCQNMRILQEIYPCWVMSSHTISNIPRISHLIILHLNQFNLQLRNMLNSMHQNQPQILQQIINYEHDMIQQRKSDTDATHAASLLVQLCTYIDGILSKMFRTSLNYIEAIIQKTQPREVVYYLDESVSLAAKMELCYLVLCLISPLIKQRQDLLQDLEQFLFLHSDKIFTISDKYPIVAFRTVKFIECHCRYLNGRLFDLACNVLIRTIREASNSLYGQQALQSLQNIVRSMPKKVQISIMDLLNFLIDVMPLTQNEQLFDMLLFIIQNYQQAVERYAISLVSLLSVRISKQLKSPLVYKLFHCLAELIKVKDIFEEDYLNMDQMLMMLVQLLKQPLDLEAEVLKIAATTVQKGQGLNYFSIECLKWLRTVYERSHQLKDVGHFIENCCVYASKQIMGEQVTVIRLFSDILLDSLHRADQEDTLSQVCQLLEVHTQAFQDYFKDTDNERQQIMTAVFRLAGKAQKIPVDMVLICLFSVRPFERPLVVAQITSSRQINKMYLLYLAMRLKTYFSAELLDETMEYLDQYKRWLANSKKTKANQMQMEDSDEEYRNNINQRYAIRRKNLSDKLQLMKLDQLQSLKATVESLKRQGLLSYEIKQKTRSIMEGLPNTFSTGVSIRQYHRIQKKT